MNELGGYWAGGSKIPAKRRRDHKKMSFWRNPFYLKNFKESPPDNLEQRLASWVGHAAQADTHHLLQTLGL